MARTVEEICRVVEDLAEHEQISQGLDTICDLVMDVISRETTLGRVLASQQLDQTCLKLGRMSPVAVPQGRDQDQVVFVVTALYRSGGHSRVLVDLAAADPGRQFTVLVTNLRHDYPVEDIEEVFRFVGATSDMTVEVAPPEDSGSRLRWLQRRLFELRPCRTYLLQHNYDSVCIAAAQPELVGQLIYIHHCDHSLALGLHIPNAVHVDLDARVFHSCRDQIGVADNVMWPLTASVLVHRGGQPFLADGHLKTATSGSTHKFDTSHFKEHLPYARSYPDIVALILKERGGEHLHIGQLSDSMTQAIREALDRAGIAHDRFTNIAGVQNLAEALIAHRIDAYVGSFPYGGGRATVEAMGAGVPLIIHRNYRSIFFSNSIEAYPEAMLWRTPTELADHLRQLTPDILRAHAQDARRHYEEHHAPHLLPAAMRATFSAERPPPPPRPRYVPDMLQAYLDEQVLLEPNQLLREEAERLKETVNQAEAKLQGAVAEKQQIADELAATQRQSEAMRNSLSWRMTAGLRAARERLQRLRRS